MPVIAILRGHAVKETVALAERCWDAGIELVEVPAQDDDGLASLEAAASAAARRDCLVGAGTVYSVSQARYAHEAGAQFIVAPGLDVDTVRATQEWGMPYLPGVVTPSEVQLALSLGLRTLKLFPAGTLGAGWITSMGGPFPQVQFVAVGGVTAATGQAFLDAGAAGIGVGSALDSAEAVSHLGGLRRCVRPNLSEQPDQGAPSA